MSHSLFIPKSTWGPGTDVLEKEALAVEALSHLWSCSGSCAGPPQGGACAEILLDLFTHKLEAGHCVSFSHLDAP